MKQAIGEAPCDRKDCEGVADVFKFGNDEAGEKRGSPFRGRMWMKCRTCGCVSGREGSQRVTDYILDKGNVWGRKDANEPASEPLKSTTVQPSQTAQVPQKTVTQSPSKSTSSEQMQPDKPARKWWETII